MVPFLHAILLNAPRNLAMSLGETMLITEFGSEPLSRLAPQTAV